MAIDTLRALGPRNVMVMVWRVKYGRQMASSANAVPDRLETGGMRFMTVSACYPGMIHPTLEERAVHVYFIQDLPISVV